MPLVDHLLQALRTVDGSRTALARALGLSRQRVGRVLRGVGYPLGPENCVRLALMNDVDPADVLEAAGHDRFAELLRQAYGAGPTAALSPRQRALVREWSALSKADRHRVDDLVRRLAADSRASSSAAFTHTPPTPHASRAATPRAAAHRPSTTARAPKVTRRARKSR